MTDILIEPLADHPECIPLLVDMLHREWGALENWSDVARLTSEISERAQADVAPLALVALDDGRLVGSVSITVGDLPHHIDKEFWVGDVIVASDQRGRGVGDMMMRAILAKASEIGIADIYLYTPDMEHFYGKRGWETVGRDPANGEDNVVMRYTGWLTADPVLPVPA